MEAGTSIAARGDSVDHYEVAMAAQGSQTLCINAKKDNKR